MNQIVEEAYDREIEREHCSLMKAQRRALNRLAAINANGIFVEKNWYE